ncbi:MAG: biopolymer transporter ExbD [Calditrichaeota bacterium]|nr:biopolymer transporter ExbD [Calditrichota bacterium]
MAYIPSRIKKHDTNPGKRFLNLTSLMDMFTIILVFLLKSYSTEGGLIHPSENLTLPKSTVEKIPETALDVIVSKETVVVNEDVVETVANVAQQEGLIVPRLRDKLKVYADRAKEAEQKYGIKFSGRVNVQADKDLEYGILVKVLATCGACEYTNLHLAVYQLERPTGRPAETASPM